MGDTVIFILCQAIGVIVFGTIAAGILWWVW